MTNPPPQSPNLPNPNPNPNPDLNPTDPPSWQTFTSLLLNSRRILCLSGAGLSAPSGLATWRGSSGHWNNIALKELASPKKFAEDPVIVWKFYGERILEALSARPNAGHWALGEMARMWGMGEGEGQRGWLTVNQNVDGLLEQTTHPTTTLKSLHGTLRTIHCTACPYALNITKPEDIPFLLTLHNPNTNMNITSQDQPQTQETPAPALTTAPTPTPQPPSLSTLPHCPSCSSLLRPSIVWFGERLAAGAPDSIDEFVDAEPIDLVISAGTSCEVYPAAEWVETARADGAVLAVIDMARDHKFADDLYEGDWFCQGDIAVILPKILGLLQGR